MQKLSDRLFHAQAVFLPVVLLLVSARDFFQPQGQPMASIHLLALVLVRIIATRLTKQAVAILGAISLSSGLAFIASQAVATDGVCKDCDSLAWLNLGALIAANLLILIAFLTNWPKQRGSLWAHGLLSVCAFIPLLQAGLLLAIPKQCFACIASGVSAILAFSLASFEKEATLSNSSDGPKLRKVFVATGLVVSALAIGGAFVQRPQPSKPTNLPSLAGQSAKVASLETLTEGRHIVLLTLAGCHWCTKAEEWFRSQGIEVKIENLRDDKFTSSRLNRGFAPQVLMLSQGTITQHIVGYDDTAYNRLKE